MNFNSPGVFEFLRFAPIGKNQANAKI